MSLGVNKEELLDINRKETFLKTLNIPIFEEPNSKEFCFKFHDVIIKLSLMSI